MAYATKYKIEFENRAGNTVKVELQYDAYAGPVIDLIGTTFDLSYENQDSSKLAGIKDSKLEFGVFVEGTYAEIFETTSQTECRVKLSINGIVNWWGWLDNTGLKYTLLDNIEVKLTARDGLHLLGAVDEKWLLTYGTNGFESPVAFIAKCLSYTLLDLDYFTWIDIYPDTYPVRGAGGDTLGANDPLDSFVIHTQSFQKGAVSYEDPYQVLSKICESFKCVFFQSRGEWHLVYIEDWVRNLGLTGTRWNYLGVAQQYVSNQRERINVGYDETTKLINENALVSYQRPTKRVRTSYFYDIPNAPIKNIDFSQVSNPSAGTGFTDFDLDLWTVLAGTAKVRRFEDSGGNEIRRVLRINSASIIQSPLGICSSGDSFSFSFSYLMNTANSLSVGVRITSGGFSPTYYYLRSDGRWTLAPSSPFLSIGLSFPNEERGVTFEAIEPIPVNGTIEIRIISSANGNTIWNCSLSYEYKPFNNFRASGHYHQSSQTTNFKNEILDNIFISDADGISIKGAMITNAVGPLQNWKHNGITESLRFSKLINRATYKLNYRNFYILEGAMMNNMDGQYLFSPLNTFFFDVYPTREFMCATLRVDLVNDTSEGTFVELLNTANTDDFDELGTEEYRFLDYVADDPEKIRIRLKDILDWRRGPVAVGVQQITNRIRRP